MVSSWPSCITSTRRLAKRRSSRSRTTWNSRSFSGSPPAMKCAEIVLGGSFSDTVRLPATKDCANHLAAERAHRVLARMRADEGVVGYLIEVQYRQQLVEICVPCCSSRKRLILPD